MDRLLPRHDVRLSRLRSRTHVPRPTRTWATTALRYLPGLLLLLAVGVIGTFAQTGLRSVATATGTRLPDIEYVLWGLCSA